LFLKRLKISKKYTELHYIMKLLANETTARIARISQLCPKE